MELFAFISGIALTWIFVRPEYRRLKHQVHEFQNAELLKHHHITIDPGHQYGDFFIAYRAPNGRVIYAFFDSSTDQKRYAKEVGKTHWGGARLSGVDGVPVY